MTSPSFYSLHPVQALTDACIPQMVSPQQFADAMAHVYVATIVCTLAVALLASWPDRFLADLGLMFARLRRYLRRRSAR